MKIFGFKIRYWMIGALIGFIVRRNIFSAIVFAYLADLLENIVRQRKKPKSINSEIKRGPAHVDRAYKIMGLNPSATDEEVRAAYRDLSFKHHPDMIRAQGYGEAKIKAATRKMAEINAAYDVIMNSRR